MIRSMRLIGSPVLIFGLASCKLECFGERPITDLGRKSGKGNIS